MRALFRYNTPDTVRQGSLRYQPAVIARHLLAPSQVVHPDRAWGGEPGPPRRDRTFVVNSRGTRGREFAVPKPGGTRRLVVVGGSSVFDIEADEGRDWPRLLESELHALGARDIEVINAGVPGHASVDALGRLYAQIWTWQPDFVLLYSGWNDVKDFTRLSAECPLITLHRPFDEGADPLRSYRNWLDRLLGHSQLYVKARNRYYLARLDLGSEGLIHDQRLADDYAASALDQYQLNLELFTEAALRRGITPILMTEATLATAEAPPAHRERIAYRYAGLTHPALARALFECRRVAAAVAQQQGAVLVDVAGQLDGRGELFVDHVHTTAAGSEGLARAAARALAPVVAPEPRGQSAWQNGSS